MALDNHNISPPMPPQQRDQGTDPKEPCGSLVIPRTSQPVVCSTAMPPRIPEGSGNSAASTLQFLNNKAGRPKKKYPEETNYSFLAPKCVKTQEAYRSYYEQEAEQYGKSRKERGAIPFIPPSGRDINDPKKWIGLPMNNQERLAFAWGAAHTSNPYGIATIINQGGPLATAISYALETVAPAENMRSWFDLPPIWPIQGSDKVITCHQVRSSATPDKLEKEMDEAERAALPATHQLEREEVNLIQSVGIKMRAYKEKNNSRRPTDAGAVGQVGGGQGAT